ncbi:MAG: hypothetical protein JWO06_2620 [Bacteroidota bacterium]|nr:hypothetical protein [Bacteroidota bacterium]
MKKASTLCLLFLLATQIINAQTIQVKGTVRDAGSKDPVAGVNIRIDKNKGGVTDEAGRFTINLTDGEHELAFSSIGYKTDKRQIITADIKQELEIDLKPNALQISMVESVSQYKKNSAKETITTDVITKDQIKNTNANDLGEIVNKSPGVLVQDGQITIRGGSSYAYGVGSRTAVLTDGLSLASADLGQSQNTLVPVEDIKQVEIIKGASSVVYGSSALNGVVNVITDWPTESEPKTTIETNMGVFDKPKLKYQKWWNATPPFFGSVNAVHMRRIKNLQLVVGGNITAINSYLQTNNEYRARFFFKTRFIHPKIAGLSFGLNGSIQIERADQFFISKNLDTFALVPASASNSEYNQTTIDPHLTYSTEKGHNYKLKIRYMNIFRNGDGSVLNAVSHFLEVDNQYQYRYKKDLFILTTGAPTSFGVSSSNLYIGTHVNFNAALYAQGEFNYKALSLQAGMRYEVAGLDTQIIKTLPVFRTGINIQAAKATWFRASWGQGFRIPTIAEKSLAQNFVSGVEIIPNDTLKEEHNWSLELGFRQGFQVKDWKIFFDAAFFWQQYKNYIEYLVGIYPNKYSNGQPIFPDSLEFPFGAPHSVLGPKPFNDENARIAGYELSAVSNGKIGPVGITITAGYSYNYPTLSSKDYSAGQFIKDFFKYNFQRVGPADSARLLNYRIRHLVHADIELSFWKMYLGASFNYGSVPEVIPGFYQVIGQAIFHDGNALSNYLQLHRNGDFYVDLRTGIKINEHFSMGFIIKNVGNRFYELRPGKAEPIRNYTLQFRYTF